MLRFFYRPKVQENNISDNEAEFVIGAYEKSYGLTVGNALRRVLLSSMPKFAPVGIQLSTTNKVQQGKTKSDVGLEKVIAKHEMDTLGGIYEDVFSVILNIKQLVFDIDEELFTKEDELIELTVENVTGAIKAKDLNLPPGVKVINSDHVIFSCSETDKVKGASLKIYLRHGRGYWLAEENRKRTWEKSSVDESTIAIDTNFSPISKVSYTVESVDNYDRPHENLVMKIKTDGSITPRDALELAGRILEQQFGAIGESSERQTLEEVLEESNVELTQDNFTLEELDLDKRTLNALKGHGVKDFRDLISRTEEEIKGVQNLGEKSFDSLKKILDQKNAKFFTEN